MNNTLEVVQEICKIKHPNAAAIFWAGSIAKNLLHTSKSDLDLVIIYNSISNPYRESFVYKNWLIDTFVNDEESLFTFFDINKKNGIPGLLSMVSEGIEIPFSTNYSQSLKQHAIEMLLKGPIVLTQDEIDSARFFITDLLDDIIESCSAHEQLTSVIKLHGLLSQFYLRAHNQWSGDGKMLVRWLKKYDEKVANEFYESFNHYFVTKKIEKIISLTDKILNAYGGRLWDGFYLKSNK